MTSNSISSINWLDVIFAHSPTIVPGSRPPSSISHLSSPPGLLDSIAMAVHGTVFSTKQFQLSQHIKVTKDKPPHRTVIIIILYFIAKRLAFKVHKAVKCSGVYPCFAYIPAPAATTASYIYVKYIMYH